MVIKNKSSKGPSQSTLIVQFIEAIGDAAAKLLTTGTSTMVALGLLAVLAVTILRDPPKMQQQILPLLTSMLSVIIGLMLTPQGALPPQPPQTPSPPGVGLPPSRAIFVEAEVLFGTYRWYLHLLS